MAWLGKESCGGRGPRARRMAHPAWERASMEARGPGGLRSAAKKKQDGFVHHPEENVGLAG